MSFHWDKSTRYFLINPNLAKFDVGFYEITCIETLASIAMSSFARGEL